MSAAPAIAATTTTPTASGNGSPFAAAGVGTGVVLVVGAALGLAIATAVAVGAAVVGAGVGDAVGAAVGATVGARVGAAVGTSVGASVAGAVGATVGGGVGGAVVATAAWTVTVPCMYGWIAQWYSNVPAVPKATVLLAPGSSKAVSKPPLFDVAVCASPPAFRQVTPSPAFTVTFAGEKLKSSIVTVWLAASATHVIVALKPTTNAVTRSGRAARMPMKGHTWQGSVAISQRLATRSRAIGAIACAATSWPRAFQCRSERK
jgi:hypothetical protein